MRKPLLWLLLLLILLFLLWLLFGRDGVERRDPVVLRTGAGVETAEFQAADTLVFDAVGLEPLTAHAIRLLGQDGELLTEMRLMSDAEGRIPAAALWYDIGAGPCRETVIPGAARTDLVELLADDGEILGRSYRLAVLREAEVVHEVGFEVAASLLRPALYAADARGCPKSGFLIGEEDVWVVGRNFPPGSLVRLWAVPADTAWEEGDPLHDTTKQYLGQMPPIFELRGEITEFKKRLWPRHLTSLGSYDIVAEVVTYPFGAFRQSATAQVAGLVSALGHSGFVIQRRPGVDPLEMDLAGSKSSPLTYQETFLTDETVWVGVDPVVQSSHIGQTAGVYIVADLPDAQWLAGTTLNDVTGYVESITVQSVCGNCWATPAWYPPLTRGEYDVVLDFNGNGEYDPGIDLIDSLDPVGFTVAEVRVASVSFRYSGSGAITIQDGGADVNPPEFLAGATQPIKPAAWVKGGAHSVRVDFQAASGIGAADVWAEGGLGGLAGSGSAVAVALSAGSGQGVFPVNSVPTAVGKHEFYWDWKYRTSSGTFPMGRTGQHLVYTTQATPVAPHAKPPLQILDYSSVWASGASSSTAVCSNILINGFQAHFTWNFDCHRLASDFVRLVSVQGVPGSQHWWSSKCFDSSAVDDDMWYQRTIPFDGVGPAQPYMAQDWCWHQWSEAAGAQWDPSAAATVPGGWGAYEDHVFAQYEMVTDTGPIVTTWVANQPGQSAGCEAPSHRKYSSSPTLYSWRGPSH